MSVQLKSVLAWVPLLACPAVRYAHGWTSHPWHPFSSSLLSADVQKLVGVEEDQANIRERADFRGDVPGHRVALVIGQMQFFVPIDHFTREFFDHSAFDMGWQRNGRQLFVAVALERLVEVFAA